MMTKNDKKKKTEEALIELMLGIAEGLLMKIKANEASPQDISNAIKLLQNNEITIAIDRAEEGLPILKEDLPFHSSSSVSN